MGVDMIIAAGVAGIIGLTVGGDIQCFMIYLK